MAKVLSRPKSICMDKSALSHRCIPPLGSFHIATPLCNKARYTSPAMSSLGWKWRRLRAMSAQEIVVRVVRAVRERVSPLPKEPPNAT